MKMFDQRKLQQINAFLLCHKHHKTVVQTSKYRNQGNDVN